MADLLLLHEAIRQAEQMMLDEIKRRWPVGSKIMVTLNCRQTLPTEMTVQGHSFDGRYVNAWMPSEKTYSGRFVKNVYFKNIEGWDCA